MMLRLILKKRESLKESFRVMLTVTVPRASAIASNNETKVSNDSSNDLDGYTSF